MTNQNALSELAYAIGLAHGTLMSAAMTIDMTPEQKAAMEETAKRLNDAYNRAFNTPTWSREDVGYAAPMHKDFVRRSFDP